MIQEYKKIIIISSIALVMFVLLMLFLFVDISLGPIQVASISTILGQYDEITQKEAELITKQSAYNTTLSTLEKTKSSYKTEKDKYEAISDETIQVIKEATTQEEYSIEFMWVRLGNYAKINNLSILLVEPGGGQAANKAENETVNNTNTKSTPVTTRSTSNDANSNNVVQMSSANNSVNNDTSLFSNDSGETFKIQVTGSYMNVSDFVFAVENDNELKFKLDNISMEYVSGTTIKATFDVKNIIIKK